MKDPRFTKFVVLVNGAVPVTLLAWDWWWHQLGANPINYSIRTTGMLTLVFLTLTLLVTPLRKITGWNWLIYGRRTLGLYAFFHGCLHFFLFFGYDRSFEIVDTLKEMFRRKYLFFGSAGLLAMIPLAYTSTNGWVKRLGVRRWKAPHRLVYVAGIAGVIHYYMLVKSDERIPTAFIAVVSLLLGFRVVAYFLRPKAATIAAVAKPRFWSGKLRVAAIVNETHDVRTFRLALPDGREGRGGEWGTGRLTIARDNTLCYPRLLMARKSAALTPLLRRPRLPRAVKSRIKREERGLVSRHLHDRLREGDLLEISAPAGRFTFDENQSSGVVLLAGGVGITPLMSIIRCLADRRWPGQIYFLFCAKSPGDIIFRQELEQLQQRMPNLHLCITLTRADGSDWKGHRGRITAELIQSTVPNVRDYPMYLCGPSAMMESTIKMLCDLGIPRGQIKTEEFINALQQDAPGVPSDAQTAVSPVPSAESGPRPVPAIDHDSRVPILTFTRSGKSASLPASKSILEAGEDAGLNLAFECRSGICGTCKTRMLAGRVTMEVQDALSPEDRAKNLILLCQAHATEDVTIEA